MKVLEKLPLRDFVLMSWTPHGRHLSPGLVLLPGEHQDKNKNHASYSFVHICSPWLLLIRLKQLACLPHLGKKLSMRKEGEPGRIGSFDGKTEAPLGLKGFESFSICPFFLIIFFRSNCVINLVPNKEQVLREVYDTLKVREKEMLVCRHQRGLPGSYALLQLRIQTLNLWRRSQVGHGGESEVQVLCKLNCGMTWSCQQFTRDRPCCNHEVLIDQMRTRALGPRLRTQQGKSLTLSDGEK